MSRIGSVVAAATVAIVAIACMGDPTLPAGAAPPSFDGSGMVGSGNGAGDLEVGTMSAPTDTTGRGGGMVGSGN